MHGPSREPRSVAAILRDWNKPPRKRSVLGAIALAAGIVAFVLAVVPMWVMPPPERPFADESAAREGDSLLSLSVTFGNNGMPRFERGDVRGGLDSTSVILAVAAIVLGALSFIRREDLRVSGGAVAFGGVALAWHAFMMALAVIVVVILVMAILGVLGSG